jgi:saccharopine dehydrogenase (NAD+, L-lysine-forming)
MTGFTMLPLPPQTEHETTLRDVGVDIVAIDHLPTLTPRESSLRFSQDLLASMSVLGEARVNAPAARAWNDARTLFETKCAEAKKELAL